MLLWLFLTSRVSCGPLWLVSPQSSRQQSSGTFDSPQMLTCSQRTREQIRSADHPPGRRCLRRRGRPWREKDSVLLYLRMPLTDSDIFPFPRSFTCRFVFICWSVMPRKDWQAPVLQKQPVRTWILYKLAILSTWGHKRNCFNILHQCLRINMQ